jgi:tetratricopeptide (TPR) repeat protein
VPARKYKRSGFCLFAGILLFELMRPGPVHADAAADGMAAAQRHAWSDAVIPLRTALEQAPDERRIRLMLARSLFHTDQLNEARDVLSTLDHRDTSASVLRAQIALAAGDYVLAQAEMEQVLAAGPDSSELEAAALVLAPMYERQGKTEQIHSLYNRVRLAAPGSFTTAWLEQLTASAGDRQRPWRVEMGYRLEHDSNVPSAPQNQTFFTGPSRRSDLRNVIYADVLGQHQLGNGFSLFGGAHLNYGAHDKLDELDYLHQNWVGALGWSNNRIGVRMPIEYRHLSVDGHTRSDAWSLAPGVVLKTSENITNYFYIRAEKRDYDDINRKTEDRSGDALLAGASIFIDGDKTDWRAIAEYGQEDADGSNWERDVFHLYMKADHQLTPKWSLSGGAEYRNNDHDNLHDLFLKRRDDDVISIFAYLNYLISKDWEASLGALVLDSDSNISQYDYDREVISLGVTWRH